MLLGLLSGRDRGLLLLGHGLLLLLRLWLLWRLGWPGPFDGLVLFGVFGHVGLADGAGRIFLPAGRRRYGAGLAVLPHGRRRCAGLLFLAGKRRGCAGFVILPPRRRWCGGADLVLGA